MRMEQLKYIAEIAKTGTISGAAKNLYVSQQAVSSSMKQLEEELGVELLVRGASGVTFTTIGHEVAEFARQTMQQHDLLMDPLCSSAFSFSMPLPFTPSISTQKSALAGSPCRSMES